MSIMDMINSSSPTLPPQQPEMTLDLPDSYNEKHCSPCDLDAASEFQYLIGMTIPPHIAKEALKLYSDNRLMLPKGPK